MRITQLKSTCCSAHIRRFGGKRRQCTQCKRTWSIRPTKRGIKKKRINPLLVQDYRVNRIGSLSASANRRDQAPDALEKAVIAARDSELSQLQPYICHEPNILLADALRQRIGGIDHVTYLILVRPLHTMSAHVCVVETVPGYESKSGWNRAFARVPLQTRDKTKALVCDGHPGLVPMASQYGWVLQRCCFHVFKELNKNMRLWHRASPETWWVHGLVHAAVDSMNDEKAMAAVALLKTYADKALNVRVASVLRGFTTYVHDCRAYIYHDSLHLPATNNSCEASFRRVRALQTKARGWRTQEAYKKWVLYVLLTSKHIACNEGNAKDAP